MVPEVHLMLPMMVLRFGWCNEPTPGSWGGIYVAAESTLSIDNAVISYGGGVTPVEGTFTAFNAIEVQQAKARIANSIFEFNAGGFGGQAPASRYGRGVNEESVIFVRDAQPSLLVILSETISMMIRRHAFPRSALMPIR